MGYAQSGPDTICVVNCGHILRNKARNWSNHSLCTKLVEVFEVFEVELIELVGLGGIVEIVEIERSSQRLSLISLEVRRRKQQQEKMAIC